jgi:hypothetical protein
MGQAKINLSLWQMALVERRNLWYDTNVTPKADKINVSHRPIYFNISVEKVMQILRSHIGISILMPFLPFE